MCKLAITVAVAFGLTALPASAQKPSGDAVQLTKSTPGKASIANVVRITASVEAIDAAARTVTLKGPRGRIVDLAVGPEVKNFDQIKVGDYVVVRYMEALTLELKKGGAGVRERSEKKDTASAQPGQRPAAAGARQITVTADVIALNPKNQTVTLKGPKRTVDLKVRDPEQFKLIKVGDQIQATYTEAAAVSVEPAPKPAGKPAAEKKK